MPPVETLVAMVEDARAAKPPKIGKGGVIGLANLQGVVPFRAPVEQGMLQVAEAAGVEGGVADNRLDVTTDLTHAESFITRNVEIVVEFPTDARHPARGPAGGAVEGRGVAPCRKDPGLPRPPGGRDHDQPFRARHGSRITANRAPAAAHAEGTIQRLGTRTAGSGQATRLLSGGNQQKDCFARWLTPQVRPLMLEEPKQGVDFGARVQLYRQINALADHGLAFLALSSEAEGFAGLSDRSFVIDRGRLAAWSEARARSQNRPEVQGAHSALSPCRDDRQGGSPMMRDRPL